MNGNLVKIYKIVLNTMNTNGNCGMELAASHEEEGATT